MNAPKQGLAMPAKMLKSWMNEQRDFLLPQIMEQRFLILSHAWEQQPQMHWIERIKVRMPELMTLFVQLETMVERTTSTGMLANLDDELFFFYILRVQSAYIHLARAPDEGNVPFDPTEQWFWLFGEREHEGMADWTVIAKSLQRHLPNPATVWYIPIPSDITPAMMGET